MSYPWIKDSQYVDPLVTGYLAITSPNGLYAANASTPTTLFSQLSDNGLSVTDATRSRTQYDALISANGVAITYSTGESNTLTAGSAVIANATSSTTYSNAGIDAGNLITSIDYQVSSNMASGNGYARLDLTSGNLKTTPPRAVLQAYVDYTAVPAYGMSLNKLDLGTSTGDDIEIINGDELNDLPENRISLHQDSSYTSNYIRLRSAFDYAGIESFLKLGIDTFSLSIYNNSAITIGNSQTADIVFRRNLSTTTRTTDGNPVGMLENSVLNTTTTATSTTLTIANAFATIINTPAVAGRIFVLPAPTAGGVGYWYAICNKSTAFTIAVQQPSGTTIATIPVAPNTTNGGSVTRFAVNSTGASYFAVSDMTNATNAANVEITSDNTSGTYYIPFAKTSGTGNKPLFIDDVTGPLTYNPSTAVLSVGSATLTSQITLPITTAASFASNTLTCNFSLFSTGVFSATLTANMTAISFSNPRTGGQYVIYVTVASGGPFTIASTLAGARTNYTTAVSVTTTTTALLTVTYDGSRYIIACSAYI